MITKVFKTFLDNCGDLNYHEMFELSQVVQGYTDESSFFFRKPASGDTHDVVIGYKPTDVNLRLTAKQVAYFQKWIEEHMMDNYDAVSWYEFQYALDHGKD